MEVDIENKKDFLDLLEIDALELIRGKMNLVAIEKLRKKITSNSP